MTCRWQFLNFQRGSKCTILYLSLGPVTPVANCSAAEVTVKIRSADSVPPSIAKAAPVAAPWITPDMRVKLKQSLPNKPVLSVYAARDAEKLQLSKTVTDSYKADRPYSSGNHNPQLFTIRLVKQSSWPQSSIWPPSHFLQSFSVFLRTQDNHLLMIQNAKYIGTKKKEKKKKKKESNKKVQQHQREQVASWLSRALRVGVAGGQTLVNMTAWRRYPEAMIHEDLNFQLHFQHIGWKVNIVDFCNTLYQSVEKWTTIRGSSNRKAQIDVTCQNLSRFVNSLAQHMSDGVIVNWDGDFRKSKAMRNVLELASGHFEPFDLARWLGFGSCLHVLLCD